MTFSEPRPSRTSAHPILWVVAGTMVAIEALVWAADRGYAPLFLRELWWLGAFYSGAAREAFASGTLNPQVIWSLVTHAFMHGGFLHVGLNCAVFLAIGHVLTRASSIGIVMAIFVASAVAGAVTFGVLSPFTGPMVGASGAVFGFLGTFTAWQEQTLRRVGAPRQAIWARIAGLVAINAILAIGFDQVGVGLAWEAHLGGFVAGWLLALVFQPRFSLLPPAQ